MPGGGLKFVPYFHVAGSKGPVFWAPVGAACFAPLSFPEVVQLGIRVARLGRSSVRYELGVFGAAELSAASGHFVHVYVDAATRRPSPLPEPLLKVLEALL